MPNNRLAPLPVRALTVYAPWAWLLAHGLKDVENRPRLCTINGPLLIHSATRRGNPSEFAAYKAAKDMLARYLETLPADHAHHAIAARFPELEALARGGIVGIVRIDGDSRTMKAARESAWFIGPHAYHIAEAKPLDFDPCRGAQGVWFYKGEKHAHARELLAGPILAPTEKPLAH